MDRIGIIANTTTPPRYHIPITSQLNILHVTENLYGDGIFPVLFCPPYLFLDIIRINHLRRLTTIKPTESTQSTALALLEHIEAFSPEAWIKPSFSNRADWVLLGNIYQSSIALYCISSLQSVSVLEMTQSLARTVKKYQSRLFSLLPEAVSNPRLKKCMSWPVVVAGMGAVEASPRIRQDIRDMLVKMSWDLGTPAPLVAREVFESFWESGKTAWDYCFDSPFCFVL